MAKNPWFRLYAEFLTDPKVQMLSETDQRRFIMLLCIRCNGEEVFGDEEIAFQLRVSSEEWLATKGRLVTRDLIDDHAHPVKWGERQFVSNSSTERVRKHREAMRQTCNVSETTPGTDTETNADAELNSNQQKQPVRPERARGPERTERVGKPKTKLTASDLVGEGISVQHAAEFLQIRQDKKLTLTPSAWSAMKKQGGVLGWSAAEVVQRCIEEGWAGFNAQWVHNKEKSLAVNSGVVYATSHALKGAPP